MNEAGKTIAYMIMLALLFFILYIAPAVIGIGELVEQHRIETGQQVVR